jgi:hypothetical protein
MMSKAIRGMLRRLTFGLVAVTTLTGCGGPQRAEGTSNGVKFQLTGAAVGKTKLHMDGTKLYINGDYYGTAVSGDTVLVSDAGVSVNGTARKKQTP